MILMKYGYFLMMIKTLQAQVCNWVHVRFLPVDTTNWYPSTDMMAGTDTFGDSTDNSGAWGVQFSHL